MLTLSSDPLINLGEYTNEPARPVQSTGLIESISTGHNLLDVLQASARLADLSSRASNPVQLLPGLVQLTTLDTMSTLAGLEALSRLRHTGADEHVVRHLDHPVEIVRRHAAWRLRGRSPQPQAYHRLAQRLTVGGIDTMHAQRTLGSWSRFDGPAIVNAIVKELATSDEPAARARLVDALGVVGDSTTDQLLVNLALDNNETSPARIAAIRSLADRSGSTVERALTQLAGYNNELGLHATIARADRAPSARRYAARQQGEHSGTGLRLAQLTLAGELDRQLSRGGRGDTGGVASLLVSLGQAMARRDDVDQVLTIGRGSASTVAADQIRLDDEKPAYGTLAYGDDARPAASPGDSWEHLATIERGIIQVLRTHRPIDVLHLRMADVGALAGIGAAAKLGIKTCFSLAPDPHGVIQSLQNSGQLDRDSFVDFATDGHAWFRARLVERMATETPLIARFPRAKAETFFAETDRRLAPIRQRSVVVPEGIDPTATEWARHQLTTPGSDVLETHGVLAELAERIPENRRHLPLLLSVGRFNPIKGMDRVARAWASNPELYESCTLVLIGGSLIDPTPVEQGVLDEIRQAVPVYSPAARGLVLLGGRPREDVALLLAATANGLPGCWGSGGTYVDGAHKEEFGLALVEALAAGLVVTAPSVGGPPTYVEDGVTGVLVDPGADLAPALRQATTLVDLPGRAERAKKLVADNYSIDTMAARLVELYAPQPVRL